MPETPMESFLKSQNEMFRRMMEDWRKTMTPGASGQSNPMEQMISFMQAMTQLSASAAEPLRAFLSTQREMSDRLHQWARLQRELAEQMDAIAQQLGAMVGVIEPWAKPMLDLAAKAQRPKDDSES